MALEAGGRGEDGVVVGKYVGQVITGEGIGCDVLWWGSGEGVEVNISNGSEH